VGGTGLEDVYTSMFFGCVFGVFVRLQGVVVWRYCPHYPERELCMV